MKKLYTILFALVLFQTAFAQEKPKTPIGGRPNIPSNLSFEFGFNQLNNRPEDMSLNFFGSRTFNVYFQHPFKIFGETSGFTFDPGIGFGTDKYAFKDGKNLFNDETKGPESSDLIEVTEVYGENIRLDKNTFAANYIDFPLDLTYHFNKTNHYKGFRVSIGAKLGLLYEAHSKIKFTDSDGLERKIKDSQNYGLEKFRYGLTLKAGSPGFYAWMYYGLNKTFQEGMGPIGTGATQLNFGVAVNVF
ncbi:PorT family protein [Algoriphagus lutimaris]|uniref:porin family protein n=1 Tax=Algoriphagus lutimaris TaxID=613197 RepID=UPI00196A483C|nr:porin family protein [Algoriphagus lutimaris]MBN3522082.1 PorT family protein [Algoriphagus lutimaris]